MTEQRRGKRGQPRGAVAPREVHSSLLASSGDLGKLLGVGSNQVNSWWMRGDRNGFPLPVASLSSGAVWDASEVQRWHVQYINRERRREVKVKT